MWVLGAGEAEWVSGPGGVWFIDIFVGVLLQGRPVPVLGDGNLGLPDSGMNDGPGGVVKFQDLPGECLGDPNLIFNMEEFFRVRFRSRG